MTTKTICGPNCKCSKHTDTPRTDAFFNRTDIEWDDEVLFARQLERELHDAEIRIQAEVSRIEMLNRELSASRAEVERLKEDKMRLTAYCADLLEKINPSL